MPQSSANRPARQLRIGSLALALLLGLGLALGSVAPASAALPSTSDLYVDGNTVAYEGPTTLYSGNGTEVGFTGTVYDATTGQPFDPHGATYDLGGGPTMITMMPTIDTQGVAGVSCLLQGENGTDGIPTWAASGALGTGIYDYTLSEPFHLTTTVKCTNTTGSTQQVLLTPNYYVATGDLPDSMYPRGAPHQALGCRPAGFCTGAYLLVKPDSTPFTMTATPAAQSVRTGVLASVSLKGTWPLETFDATFSRRGCMQYSTELTPHAFAGAITVVCETPGDVTATIRGGSAFDPFAETAGRYASAKVRLHVTGHATTAPGANRRVEVHAAANSHGSRVHYRVTVTPADAHRVIVQVKRHHRWVTAKRLSGSGGRFAVPRSARARVVAPADARSARVVRALHRTARA